ELLVMETPSASSFDCPNCGAGYKVVRMESDAIDVEGQIVCRRCGGPLFGGGGRKTLKYFLLCGRGTPAFWCRSGGSADSDHCGLRRVPFASLTRQMAATSQWVADTSHVAPTALAPSQ